MTEKDILDKIAESEKKKDEANRKLAKAKKEMIEAESLLIESKIELQRLREQLREFRQADPNLPPDMRDLEIQKFRNENPELCEWARQRDLAKSGE